MALNGRTVTLLLSLAVLLLWPVTAAAQNAGAIRGQVVDDAGQPLEGVTVAVSSRSQTLSGRGAVSAAGGSFVIPSLPPARDYEIRVAHPGFISVSLTSVTVLAGQITRIAISMERQNTLREQIEVKGALPIVGLESTTNSTFFSAEFIDSMPILGRNYQDILALAPGVTDIDGDGNPNIHGARETNVITLVDGVSTTDPLTGKIGAQLNLESIQEIEIKTAGATAEFSRAQGGFANIITKSGGNDFQGTFKFFWRGSQLDGDGAGIDPPETHGGVGESGLRDLKFNTFTPFLSFEGPIVRDKAWFFMAHEYVSIQDPVNALTTAFVTTTKEWREFLKLTWQISQNHRLAFSFNYDPQELLNQGLTSLVREESGYIIERGGTVLTLKSTSILSPLVSLDAAVSFFDESPSLRPTLNPDSNGNGILSIDRNRDGFFAASEIDPGEDYDNDGAFDLFEDDNGDGILTVVRVFDPETGEIVEVINEDADRDGRLTSAFNGTCEGSGREDLDCDGHLDQIDEDPNGNRRCDVGEPCDIDSDGRLERGIEDRNGNRKLDDRPFPAEVPGVPGLDGVRTQFYPYGRLTPIPGDRQYTIEQQRGITSGPYFEDYDDERTRFTLRQDLSVFVADFWGSHDLKGGFVIEQESFRRRTTSRPIFAPLEPDNLALGPGTVRAIVPSENAVANEAENTTLGFYVQDNFKPFPNLSIGLGLRFDREATDSFGFTSFDPRDERAQFDRMIILIGGEADVSNDLQLGNNDGIRSRGILADPLLFSNDRFDPMVEELSIPIRQAALSRLTRHRIGASFESEGLRSIYPELFNAGGSVTAEFLRSQGIVAQQPESFRLTNNNLAPRLSVSWDPFSDGRTKVFGTWGRYYDKLFLNTVLGEEGPDTINRYYFADPFGASPNGVPNGGIGRTISRAPPSTTQIDRGLQTPYNDEWTLGFEREIAPEIAFSVSFISRKFRDQLQDVDINHSLRVDSNGNYIDAIGGPCFSIRCPDGRPDLYIENFFFNQVLRVGNFNQADYRALEFALVKRLSRRWEMQASYTYSRALGAAEDFQSRLGNDPSTVESEFGYLDFDQRHVIKLNTVLFLPGDWQFGVAASWSSGLPYSVVNRFFATDNFDYLQFRTRFGFVDDGNNEAGERQFVTLPRNNQRNHPIYDINLRARKSMVIGRFSAAVFFEVFNLLNTDDLRIFTFDPTAPQVNNATPDNLDPDNVLGAVQLDAQRRFGRRYQVGFQFDF